MNFCEFNHFPDCSYAVQEAFNTLSMNLAFSGDSIRKIMITSSHAGEGKTFITMNLMRTLARLGRRVVLVDADLRRSQIRARYDLKTDLQEWRGLSHYLAGMCTGSEVIYETNLENAYLVPVGRGVKNSLQLLNSPRFTHLLDGLAEQFDYVLVDAPPVGVIIDAAQIAKSCDGTILAVQHNSVSKKMLREVTDQIRSAGCQVLGAVLNDVEMDSFAAKRYYGYNQGYYYYDNRYNTERQRKHKKKPASK